MRAEPRVARDPVTGTPAYRADGPLSEKPTVDELTDRIRGIRARMTATLDEIEERLAPARLADEVRRTVSDTIDDVRDSLHPRRMAKQAGDTMLETIKENPIPALAAGLSIGYMIMKGMESDDRFERRSRRRSGYEGYGARSMYGRGDRPWEYDYRFEENPPYGPVGEYGTGEFDERESRRERMASKADEIRQDVSERTGEIRHEIAERTEQFQRRASERARDVGRRVERRAVRAERSIEDFVHENPIMAGLITAGIGALIGAALPSTHREDELMGHARDEVVDRARHVAHEKSDRARDAARRVGEEAKHHAEDLARTASEEARSVARSDGSSFPAADSSGGSRSRGGFGEGEF
ncbi:MAG TPA: hypothetical protein VF190_12040 [Rhodothermales bacterium]